MTVPMTSHVLATNSLANVDLAYYLLRDHALLEEEVQVTSWRTLDLKTWRTVYSGSSSVDLTLLRGELVFLLSRDLLVLQILLALVQHLEEAAATWGLLNPREMKRVWTKLYSLANNNPILDRFTAKSILKHQEVLNVPKPKMSYRLEDYRCGDGPSNLCTKNHYVKSYFLKWDMNPTSNTAKQSGKALLETIRGDNWARNYSRELQSKRDSTILNSTPLKRDTFGSTGIWSSAQVRESTYQNVDRYQRVTSSNQKGSEIFWSRSKLF